MKWNCKNTKTGCQEVLADYALKDHKSTCIYCPINPISGNCTDLIFRDVCEHIEQKHGRTHFGQHPNFQGWISKANTNFITRFEFDGYNFFSWIIFLDNDAFAWPYILASPNEAKHFSYTWKFIGPKTSLTFEGQEVVSIDTYVVTKQLWKKQKTRITNLEFLTMIKKIQTSNFKNFFLNL